MLDEIVKGLIANFPQLIFFLGIALAAAVVLREFRSIRRELSEDIQTRVKAEMGALMGDVLKQIEQSRGHLAEERRLELELRQERETLETQIKQAKVEIVKMVEEAQAITTELRGLVPAREELSWISPELLILRAQQATNWEEVYGLLAKIDMENATSTNLETAGDICRNKFQHFAKAIEFYRQAVEKDPENTSARVEFLALTAEFRAKEREDALGQLQDLVLKNISNEIFVGRYFDVLIETNRYQQMAEFCEARLKELVPLDQSIRLLLHRNLAIAFSHQPGRMEDALHQFEEGLKLDPNDESLLNAYSGVLRRLERLDEAAEIKEKLLEINPTHAEYYATLARIRKQQRKFGEAKDLLQKALPYADEGARLKIESELKRVTAMLHASSSVDTTQ